MELSIILPVYNVETYISKCIDSILKIPNKNFELIVVDDCGTDNSITIIENKLKNNPIPYKIIKHPKNSGLAIGRNTGLKYAQGEYIYFSDSDDYIESENFSTLFQIGYSTKSDIFLGDFNFDKEGKIILQQGLSEVQFCCEGKSFLTNYYRQSGSVVWRYFYRKDFLIEHNLHFKEIRLQEDIEFSPRAIYMAKNITYIPLVFYFYRIRENSLMGDYTKQRFNDNLKVCDSLYEFALQCTGNTEKECIHDLSNSYFLNNIALYMKDHTITLEEERSIKIYLKKMQPTKKKIWFLKNISKLSFSLFIKVVVNFKPKKKSFRI